MPSDEALQSGALQACTLTLPLALSPAWAGRELSGACAAADSMLLRYNSDVGGVLLAYARPRFAPGAAGRIIGSAPAIHVRLLVDALMLAPRLGSLLRSRVNIVGPGHVGCLVGGLFSAAVLSDDLACGYIYSEAEGAWLATEEHAAALVGAANVASGSAGGGGSSGKKRRREAAVPGTYNRVLAGNPPRLEPGAIISFRLKSMSVASGLLSMHGTFVDPQHALQGVAPGPPARRMRAGSALSADSAASRGATPAATAAAAGAASAAAAAAAAATAAAAAEEATAVAAEAEARAARKAARRAERKALRKAERHAARLAKQPAGGDSSGGSE